MVYASRSLRGPRSNTMGRTSKHVKDLVLKHDMEEFERSIHEQLTSFLNSADKEIILESINDYNERHLIHSIACDLELRTHTIIDDYTCKIRVVKPQFTRSLVLMNAQIVKLDKDQDNAIYEYLNRFPISSNEFNDHFNANLCSRDIQRNTNFQQQIHPLVPPAPRTSNDMSKFRQRLPATKFRDQIISLISKNKVTVITGGTGCGKTTQVPQFLLEEATRCREPIRIFCTQPRRLPAIAVAERVSKERGEQTGDTVGYHIRLEQKTSESTVLTYSTSGVLLRMLSADSAATGITHIILDEVHEREQNTDYLLIILREALKQREDLKVILMSATIEGNRQMFENYFSRFKSCGRCDIPSRLYSVEKLYLPDILALTGYMPTSMFAVWGDGNSKNFETYESQQYDPLPTVRTVPDLQSFENQNGLQSGWHQPATNHYVPPPSNQYQQHADELTRSNTVPSNLQYAVQPGYYNPSYYYDNNSAMSSSSSYVPSQPIQQPYMYDNNWQMQQNYYPPQQYPNYQQIPPQQPSRNVNSDYQINTFGQKDSDRDLNVLLNEWLPERPSEFDPEYIKVLRKSKIDKELLVKKYLKHGGQQWTESVDTDLALATIKYCSDSLIEGSILVFLPGYDDIINLRDKVQEMRSDYYKPIVFTLHSQMNSHDQQRVFEEAERGCRKVILSTNIAEASLTIDDVVFVIDCGKVKEKTYEHNSRISQLKVSWIAKSNAEQRAGRAGRCRDGFCFRLYSQADYDDMLITQVCEMRRSAIHELCLNSKMFAPNGMSVRRFLDNAPEPPIPQAIDRSLEFLEQIGALYNYEKSYRPASSFTESYRNGAQVSEPELTNLGRLIANLPLDPPLARLLLFGVAMKVLQPIISLVAILAHRDPFSLPNGDDKAASILSRDKFTRLDYSDHLMLLRVLNAYCDVHSSSNIGFCRQNFLSKPALIMILGIRRQLFGELTRLRIVPQSANSFEDPELNQFSTSWPMIQGVIAAGSYPNIAFIRSGSKLRKIHTIIPGSTSATLASLHPSSSLRRQVQSNKRSDYLNDCSKNEYEPNIECLVYQELSKIDEGLTLRTVSAIPPLAALMFSGPIRMQKFIVDDFELAEEDYDAQFFPRSNNDETELVVHEPDFENEDSMPQRYVRDYYVEVDLELAFSGQFRELQNALRLRFKLASYFLRFLEKPLQPLNEEDFELLRTISTVLEVDAKNYCFNEVTDTLPKRQNRNNPVRYSNPRPALSIPEERRRIPSPPKIQNRQIEDSNDSPPADPAPSIPSFDNSTAIKQRNNRNDRQPQSQKILEELTRAQNKGGMRREAPVKSYEEASGSNRKNEANNQQKRRPYEEPVRKEELPRRQNEQSFSRFRGYGQNQQRISRQISDEGRNNEEFDGRGSGRNKNFDGRNSGQFRGGGFDQNSQSLYVPPARRTTEEVRNPMRKGRFENVNERFENIKIEDNRQNEWQDDQNRKNFNRTRGGYPTNFNFRGGRGNSGTPKVFSNPNFKKKSSRPDAPNNQ